MSSTDLGNYGMALASFVVVMLGVALLCGIAYTVGYTRGFRRGEVAALADEPAEGEAK